MTAPERDPAQPLRRGGPEVVELTAQAAGAVSVLRLRGAGALEVARRLGGGVEPVPGLPRLVRLVLEGGELLDEALLVPLSEREVELHVHGSRPLVRRLLVELGAGSSPAGGIEERAEAALTSAASEAAARVLLDQVEGSLRRELERIRSLVEAGETAGARAALGSLAEAGRRAAALFRPPLVVLAGPANAGKSTLFNALVGHERVVVDPAAGTTRDAVLERTTLGAWAIDLADTAGLRGARGPGAEVERAGQGLARRLAARADLVLWLDPAASLPPRDAPPGGPPGGPVVRLRSRADEVPPGTLAPDAAVATTVDPAGARRVVADAVARALGLAREPWVPGAPVPFDETLRSGIEAGLAAGTADERGRLLGQLLTR